MHNTTKEGRGQQKDVGGGRGTRDVSETIGRRGAVGGAEGQRGGRTGRTGRRFGQQQAAIKAIIAMPLFFWGTENIQASVHLTKKMAVTPR